MKKLIFLLLTFMCSAVFARDQAIALYNQHISIYGNSNFGLKDNYIAGGATWNAPPPI